MPNYSISTSQVATHQTTSGSAAVDTITLDRSNSNDWLSGRGGSKRIKIINRDGADTLYYTLDGTAPTVGGANTRALVGTGTSAEEFPSPVNGLVTISVTSTAATKYSVQVTG